MARWLSDAVGDRGSVTAIDRDTALLEELGTRPNVTVLEDDLMTMSFGISCFDLVHSRAVLMHLDDPDTVVEHLVPALSPGAVVLFEETDGEPAERAAAHTDLPAPFCDVMLPLARQWTWARTLPARLVALGFTDVQDDVRDDLLVGATPAAAFWRQTLTTIRPIVTDGARDGGARARRRRRQQLRRHDRAARRPLVHGALRGPAPGVGPPALAGPAPAGLQLRSGPAGSVASATSSADLGPALGRLGLVQRAVGIGVLGALPRSGSGPAAPTPIGWRPRGRAPGTGQYVDVLRPLGHRGAEPSRPHGFTWTNPPWTASALYGAVLVLEPHQPGDDGADERGVTGQEGGVAPVGPQDDRFDLFFEHDALGGDQAGRESGHRLLGPRLEAAGLLQHRLDPADVQERLLGYVVEVAVEQHLEGLHRLLDRDGHALEAR